MEEKHVRKMGWKKGKQKYENQKEKDRWEASVIVNIFNRPNLRVHGIGGIEIKSRAYTVYSMNL